ncbi:MAG TPA: ATP-binding protein [Candidatus Binatia bacterium]|nr:ATP-binding protein [Candidatus Binatia bacterium]
MQQSVGDIVSLAKRVGGRGKLVFCHARNTVNALLARTRLDQIFQTRASDAETGVTPTNAQPAGHPQAIRLVIDSSLQNVPLVGAAVNALCASLSLEQIDAYQIELCAVEAVTNAIKHAYDNRLGFPVQVLFTTYPDKLVLAVCDEGKKMAELVAPSLDFDPADREHLPEGGMGLFLIHSVMDKVTYTSRRGKNTLTMVKKL